MSNEKVKNQTLGSLHDIDLKTLESAMMARVPAMLVGPPGTGKTATIKKIARDMGYRLETVIGSRMDPTDVTGLPQSQFFGETEDKTKLYATAYSMPVWQANILRHPKTILFLDEFSNTPSEVRASFLNIIEDREFPSGAKMPPETIIVGAMNPTEQAADGFELDLPTTNRMFFMEWRPTLNSWLEGMENAWGRENVSEQEMKYRKKIIRFISDNPGRLEMLPGNENSAPVGSNPSAREVSMYAWSSRRSWDKVAMALGVAPERAIIQDTLTKGLIGYSNSAAFRDFLSREQDYNPEDILKNPESVDWTQLEVNEVRLILQSVTDITTERLNSENLAKNPDAADYMLQQIAVLQKVADADRAAEGVAFIQGTLRLYGITKRSFSPSATKKIEPAIKGLMGAYKGIAKNVVKK